MKYSWYNKCCTDLAKYTPHRVEKCKLQKCDCTITESTMARWCDAKCGLTYNTVMQVDMIIMYK